MRVLFIFLLMLSFSQGKSQELYLLLGTYDSPKSEGVYVYRFNMATGDAVAVSHIKNPNSSFITISPDERFVYAVQETRSADGSGGKVSAFSFNKQAGILTFINEQSSGGDHPCHVEIDKTGKWLFAANYSGGSLASFPVLENGALGPATLIKYQGSGPHPRQKSSHVHGNTISADNRFLMTTDLGSDKIMIHAFDEKTGRLIPSDQPFVKAVPGSGPRIFAFHPNNKYGYAIEELSGTVTMYSYKKGKLKQQQRISSMPAGDTSFAGSADIKLSPDGKFLYASNRGDANTMAIYQVNRNGKLKLIDITPTLGKAPRFFSISPNGKYLLAANQNSDEVVVFLRNAGNGLLTDSGKRIKLGKPVSLVWVGR